MKDFFEKYEHQLMWEPNSGCCIWIGAQAAGGYGHGHRDGKHFYAHRAAFECVNGPTDLDVLHRCDFPPCCNPDHLFDGDAKANADDMLRKGRCRSIGHAPGPRHPRAKLTAEQVLIIRSSPDPVRSIARTLGVGASQISRIKRGRSRLHG